MSHPFTDEPLLEVIFAIGCLVFDSTVLFNVEVGLYPCLGLVFRTVLVDNFIESLNLSKSFNMFYSRRESICDFIVHELKRSATICGGQGAFTGSQKYILITGTEPSSASNVEELYPVGRFIGIYCDLQYK